ncbi:uncharacterized protein AB675_8559 [Cyphellophora attinorum]|uniref:SET domain-containing protein n=1 Tax=Cyphellophora attinorum TaxID=1664694 RepID=A0A0N1P359_9EURO|nr:uncharacterized protein AB675_8559 [Phialophora attinorum]KPI44586.1 hypothetical protein AB675_8559 [Phialophora attinorum]
MPKLKSTNSAPIPEKWPSPLPYLTTPQIGPSLPRNILSSTNVTQSPSLEANTPTMTSPSTPYNNIRITPISDPTHPACGQAGLFTTRLHAPGEFVCLYMGLVHGTTGDHVSESAAEVKSDYDLSLDRDLGLAIDAAKMGNEARFINDYRGVAERPNAEFGDVLVKVGKGVLERHVGVFVKPAKKEKKTGKGKGGYSNVVQGIAKGEEVLVSYGRGFWSARRVEAEAGIGEVGCAVDEFERG